MCERVVERHREERRVKEREGGGKRGKNSERGREIERERV